MIQQAFAKLDAYCRDREYKGWDLFDGLNSRVFYRTPFNRSTIAKLIWIQMFKRSPVNLRHLLGVPQGDNPKGLALFASGLIVQGRMDEARVLLVKLKDMMCSGYSGISWGYNFPWQARAFYVPKGKPNMVTTVFATHAFLDFLMAAGSDGPDTELGDIHAVATGAGEFILKHLIVHEDKGSLCFGYIPGEAARVHNANMLGAALLGRVYSMTGIERYYRQSKKAMQYSMSSMSEGYFWPYGERRHHRFIDNFHTGFNLVALQGWMQDTQDFRWRGALENAFLFFLRTFWLENGCPKYYHNSLYPVDIHCSAQGIVTCLKLLSCREDSLQTARKIATWAVEQMQDDRGFFYYQKTRWYTNRIPYIRWSQAWMFYALALLMKTEHEALIQ